MLIDPITITTRQITGTGMREVPIEVTLWIHIQELALFQIEETVLLYFTGTNLVPIEETVWLYFYGNFLGSNRGN